MKYNAREESWIPMVIRGVKGYFNDMRIDRETVPKCFYLWELADDGGDGIPCRYRPDVMVNFFGTFITSEELPVDDPEWEEGFICSGEEWAFTGDRYYPFGQICKDNILKKSHG